MTSAHDDPNWQRLGSRYLFRSRWYNLRQDQLRLPSGADVEYTLVEHPGYALIVPLLDDGRVIMERVYRYPLGEWLLECPSGGFDGDEPAVAARREIEEETGYRARDLHQLGRFYSSTGNSNECCYAFLATGLTADGRRSLEITEQLEIELIPLADLEQMALTGAIQAVTSAHALILAAAHLRLRGTGG